MQSVLYYKLIFQELLFYDECSQQPRQSVSYVQKLLLTRTTRCGKFHVSAFPTATHFNKCCFNLRGFRRNYTKPTNRCQQQENTLALAEDIIVYNWFLRTEIQACLKYSFADVNLFFFHFEPVITLSETLHPLTCLFQLGYPDEDCPVLVIKQRNVIHHSCLFCQLVFLQ